MLKSMSFDPLHEKDILKVVDLLCRECNCKPENICVNSRLDTDLGISGQDAYDLLQAMETQLNVDMSEFDCCDYVSPEHMSVIDTAVLFAVPLSIVLSALLVRSMYEEVNWCYVTVMTALFTLVIGVIYKKKASSKKPVLELRVEDLVRSVQAKKWVAPSVNVTTNSYD